MILTRLELFVQSRNLVLATLARLSGCTPLHLRRLRADEASATRSLILAVTGAARKLSRERVPPGMLFERADAFLRGPGHRLSGEHRKDRQALDALLAEPVTPQLSDRVKASGIASEAAVRHLLRAGRSRLDTAPAAAVAIYEAAAHMATALQHTPPQLAISLQAHAYRGLAEALKMTGAFEDALTFLATAGERFVAVGLCSEDAAVVDFTRAAILAEMELWDDALPFARSARRRASQSGNIQLAASAEQIEAAVLFERGDSDEAHKRWFRLSKVLYPPRNPKEEENLARVWMNLGICEIQRKRPAEALAWLNKADTAFRKLNNTAELARTRWNVATHARTFEGAAGSLSVFRETYLAFRSLQMWMDAGCVGLDMAEAMIDTKAPEVALTRHACEVADTFEQLPFADEMRSALDLLRRIAAQKDRRGVIRKVRTAFLDAKGRCSKSGAIGAAGAMGVEKAG